MDMSVVYVTCTDGVVFALQVLDGTENWSFRTGYSIAGSATLSPDGSALFFGGDDGRLYALNANVNTTTKQDFHVGRF
jgi:outer membrane protein assembly factor BamB